MLEELYFLKNVNNTLDSKHQLLYIGSYPCWLSCVESFQNDETGLGWSDNLKNTTSIVKVAHNKMYWNSQK